MTYQELGKEQFLFNVMIEVYADLNSTIEGSRLLQALAWLSERYIQKLGGNQETDFQLYADGYPNTELWLIVQGYPLPQVILDKDITLGLVRAYERDLTTDTTTDPVKVNSYKSYPYDIDANASADVVKTNVVENEKAHSLTTEGGNHTETEKDRSVEALAYYETVMDDWARRFALYFIKLTRTNATYF